ncbi:MAG: DUF262 domain-containing HNH endonuclease family protein [Bacteroidales bacterium]
MEVEARNLRVRNIFGKGKFIIPNYQREYAWDDKDFFELIEDIEDTKKGDGYFIGHMVFKGAFNGSEFEVIDGQQRITTLTIILCAIRDYFYSLGEDDYADGIHNKYIFGVNDENKPFPVLENKMPYPILQSYIQNKPNEKDKTHNPKKNGEKKIVLVYDKFYKYISKHSKKDLIELRDKVLDLEAIFVAATDIVSANTIFMTLNATGKDLKPIDLVKNTIFINYPTLPHIDEPNDSWNIILRNTIGSTKFLNNFYASRFKKVSDKRIFKEIFKILKDKDQEGVKAFLINLKGDSDIFRKITLPDQMDWKTADYCLFESIYAITQVFKIVVANAFLMSLLREYLSGKIKRKMVVKTLSSIEKVHFIHNAICSNRSSGFDQMYSKYAKLLTEGTTTEKKHLILEKIIKELNLRIPNKIEYDSNFEKKLYYSKLEVKQKELVKYVLIKIERKKNINSLLINTSIEHIYPEKQTKWSSLKDPSKIKSIGNLVLLDSGINSSIGNAIYQQKKNIILKDSQIISTKEVFETNTEWGDIQIENRINYLKDYLYEDVWK